jgi:hypothetical protein
VLLLVSLTEERAIYLALELDRSWTEMTGVNPLGGTNYLDTAFAFTIVRLWTLRSSEERVAACDDRPAHCLWALTTFTERARLRHLFRQLKSSSRLELNALPLLERNP